MKIHPKMQAFLFGESTQPETTDLPIPHPGEQQPGDAASPPEGENPVITPEMQPRCSNAISPGEQEEYRTERAGIMEYSGNLSKDEAEYRAVLERPCSCGGRRFWVSIHGPIVCGGCHPPARPGLVNRWIDLPGE